MSAQPTLQWLFESSNVDSITGLAPFYSTPTSSTQVAPAYVGGKYGQGISFVNTVAYGFPLSNSYMYYTPGSGLGLTANNMTVSFWLKPLGTANNGNQTIFQLTDSISGSVYSYNQNQSANSGIPTVLDRISAINIAGTTQTPPNIWANIGIVTSNVGAATNNVLCTYYLNGNMQGSTNNLPLTSTSGYINQIWIASINNGAPNGSHPAWCSFDDLRIYNTALSAAQIQTIYALQGFPPQVNLGTLSAGACTLANPLIPSYSTFLGSSTLSFGTPSSNNSVYIPASAGSYMNLGLNIPSNFSLAVSNCFIETWVYIVSLSASSQPVVARQIPSIGTQLALTITNTTVSLSIKQAVGGAGVSSTNTFSLSTSTWYHIAGSWNLQTLALNVFINGFGGNSTTVTLPQYFYGIPTTIGGSYSNNGTSSYYIQDARMTQGGSVPIGNFTPVQGPFPNASPAYVAGMGPVVLSLNSSYIRPQSTMA